MKLMICATGELELSDDILHGEHGSESHVTVDYGSGGKHRYDDVLDLVDEYRAGFLGAR